MRQHDIPQCLRDILTSIESIDDETIWGIVVRQLPQLRAEVERLLAE